VPGRGDPLRGYGAAWGGDESRPNPGAANAAGSRRAEDSAGIYSLSETDAPTDDKGKEYMLFHIHCLLQATMNFIFT